MAAGLRKFVPVLLPGGRIDDIPTMLQPYSATHCPVTELTHDGVQRIVRLLRRDPETDDETPPKIAHHREEGLVAVLRLSVCGGTPAGADAVVRELIATGAAQVVPDFDEGTRPTGAVLSGRPEVVVPALGRVARRLRAVLDRHDADRPPGDHLVVSVGGHVATTTDVAAAEAADLADGAAARRMHAVSDAGLVVVSPALHRCIETAKAPYPAARAYRKWSLDGDVGRPVHIAVPGRSMCPELPPPPAQPARNATPRDVRVGGNNLGVIGGDL